jgi:hypothetical protein
MMARSDPGSAVPVSGQFRVGDIRDILTPCSLKCTLMYKIKEVSDENDNVHRIS